MEKTLTKNQEQVLFVYSLYTSEESHKYLQYTAALAIFYKLMVDGFFKDYNDEILLYDYKEYRRFLWEDKTFMNDINILRAHKFLKRARVRTATYRDINAHQITSGGENFIKKIRNNQDFENIEKSLRCKLCGLLMEIELNDNMPRLMCKCKISEEIKGFLKDSQIDTTPDFRSYFL
ncbi:MAG: hypothetical protein JXR63_13780 [Spirochaetales bacterium]|nr:hypothetical protein [Spirochaetales bacterium]